MLPADECLDAADGCARKLDDRLVVETQLAIRDRGAKTVERLEPG